jgi:hypothetical protein
MEDQGQNHVRPADSNNTPGERAYRARSIALITDVINGNLPTATIAYLADVLFTWSSGGSDYGNNIDGFLKAMQTFTADGQALNEGVTVKGVK